MGPMGVGASIYKESSIVDNPGVSLSLEFSIAPTDCNILFFSYYAGPGTYKLQGMGDIKVAKTLKWSKSENSKKKKNSQLHPPSIPRLEQSYGFVHKFAFFIRSFVVSPVT